MRIDLDTQDKAYCEVIGIIDPPEYVVTTREEYDRNFSAWRNSLPDSDEKTIRRKVIGRLVHKRSGPIPSVRSGDSAVVQDAVNAIHVETQRHIRDLTQKHLPEVAEIHRQGMEAVAGAIDKLASEMDDKEKLFRDLHKKAAAEASEERNKCALVAHRDSIRSEKWLRAIAILITLLIASTLFGLKAHAQFSKINYIKFQQDAGDITGAFFTYGFNINCSTNVTCTVSGNTLTITATGGSASPGGSNTQVQFNDSSAFGGDAGFTYVKATDVVSITGGLQLGTCVVPLPTDYATVTWWGAGAVSAMNAIGKTNTPGSDTGLVYTALNIGHTFDPSVNVATTSATGFSSALVVPAGNIKSLNFLSGATINVEDDGTGPRGNVDGVEAYVLSAGANTVQSGIYGSVNNSGSVGQIAGIAGYTTTTGANSVWNYGAYGDATNSTTSGTTPLNVGVFGRGTTTTGTVTENHGVYATGTTSGGTVGFNGNELEANVTGGTVTDNTVLLLTTGISAVTPTRATGLKIDAVTGATTNRAIKTSTGIVELGDDLIFTNDNTDDIGASGATRPRRGYFGTEVVAPLMTATTFAGNASTATALAANPSDCSADNFATTIAASGNLTCQPLSWLTGNLTLWDSANASRTLTFGLSGATDPVLTISNNSFDLTTGVMKYGGNTVGTSANNLSFFSATTSAQFLGVISDEVGSGSKVAKFDSVSGNSGVAAQSSGTLTSGNCAKFDANGNIVDYGAGCGGGTAAVVFYKDASGTVGDGTDQTVMGQSISSPGAGKCVRFSFGFIDFNGSTGAYELYLNLGTTKSSLFWNFAVGVNTNWNGIADICNNSGVQNAQTFRIDGFNTTSGVQNGATSGTFAEDWSSAKTVSLIVKTTLTPTWKGGGGIIDYP